MAKLHFSEQHNKGASMRLVILVFYIVSFFAILLNSIQERWLPAISCILMLILSELVQIQHVLKNKNDITDSNT